MDFTTAASSYKSYGCISTHSRIFTYAHTHTYTYICMCVCVSGPGSNHIIYIYSMSQNIPIAKEVSCLMNVIFIV